MAGWAAAVVLCASAGCSTRMSAVRPLAPERETEINNLVAGKTALLTIDGHPQAVTGKNVRLAGDRVRFLERDPASTWHLSSWLPETSAPLTSVQTIKVRNTGRGAVQGLAIGAPIGLVLGGIVAGLSSGLLEQKSNALDPFASMAAGVLVSGLIGAGIGAAIGAPTTIGFENAATR